MTIQFVKKALALVWVVFILSAVILYLVGGEQLYYASVDTGNMVQATNEVGELTTGKVIEQPVKLDGTELEKLVLHGSDYGHQVGGIMEIAILNANRTKLYSERYDMGLLSQSPELTISFSPALQIGNSGKLLLQVNVIDGSDGSVPTLYYGSTISISRGEAKINLTDDDKATVNGELLDGVLCVKAYGRAELWFGPHYGYFVLAAATVLAYVSWTTLQHMKQGKDTFILRTLSAAQKYRFLIEQLVSRDFKSKYKRSILGVLWSLLNPLLMMSVQYIVFSTIFRSDIENFAVYLLTGIVCYNFFSEVTNLSVTSIVGNASLITKVYVPKVVYPLSRAISSMINFLLSLIPLLVVLLVTRTRITFAMLLLPFDAMCLLLLGLGVGMVLASSMVFFRDTQFLWNVISLAWMYMTPIFYPENIVSGWLAYIFKVNPLYHIIRFFRIVLLNGVSPEPKAYLFCFIAAVVPFVIGSYIFHKTEDRFALYI